MESRWKLTWPISWIKISVRLRRWKGMTLGQFRETVP